MAARKSYIPSVSEEQLDQEGQHQEEQHLPHRPVTIFGFDISKFSPSTQFAILGGGYFFFTYCYSILQRRVIYDIFERKESSFATFMHFLGSFICIHVIITTSCNNKKTDNQIVAGNAINQGSGSNGPLISDTYKRTFMYMGSAPPMKALGYYSLLILLKVTAQSCGNLAMQHLNYTAKLLCKSMKPVVTVLIGTFWFRKSYPLHDYIAVVLLVIGIYTFIDGDMRISPTGTSLGIVLVLISMFTSAGTPMVKEHVLDKFNPTIEELLYWEYLGCAITSFVYSLLCGELQSGLNVLLSNSRNFTVWVSMTGFCTFTIFGALFSSAIISRFGSLVNGVTVTSRKAMTLALLMIFTNVPYTSYHIVGAVTFFIGLSIRLYGSKDSEGGASSMKKKKSDLDDSI